MSVTQKVRSTWASLHHLYSVLSTLRQEPAQPQGNELLEQFISRCRSMEQAQVLELGTRQSIPGRSTMHRDWIPDAGSYLGTDIAPGEDVDIVADVHRLTETVGGERFDVIISCSTFEHLKYPHLAAHELMKALKVGGVLFIQTHQTFPLHSYPYDYFRFSREALAGLFGTEMGFEVIATDYEFPARILTRRERIPPSQPSFLNVRLFGEKRKKTPPEYIFEFDVENLEGAGD